MNVQWTTENVEEKARAELGDELAAAAQLFPRVVYATYVQMMNGEGSESAPYTTSDYRKRICLNLPTSLPEVLPFFVRHVWNQKWTFEHNRDQILRLAWDYTELLAKAGTQIDASALADECKNSFSHWQF